MRKIAILMVLGHLAWADPPAKVSAADQKTYATALKQGRDLQAKKKWLDAEAAFDACLKVVPDDAVALGELGWTAYLAKDLAKAETMTRRSLANQAAPNVRGASLYNLGLIEDELGHRAEAIAAYSESLRARPSSVVRARLVKLDPAIAAQFDPFAPHAFAGPFVSIEAFCKTTATSSVNDLGDKLACKCGALVKNEGPKNSPFEKVEAFTRTCMQADSTNRNGGFGVVELKLAVKLAIGWFVGAVDTHDFNRHCADEIHFDGVTIDRGVRALVKYNYDGDCSGGIKSLVWNVVAIVAIEIGKSGSPSATPPIAIKRVETSESFETEPSTTTTDVDVALDLAWGKDGALEIKGKAKGLDRETAAGLIGKHTLVFP